MSRKALAWSALIALAFSIGAFVVFLLNRSDGTLVSYNRTAGSDTIVFAFGLFFAWCGVQLAIQSRNRRRRRPGRRDPNASIGTGSSWYAERRSDPWQFDNKLDDPPEFGSDGPIGSVEWVTTVIPSEDQQVPDKPRRLHRSNGVVHVTRD